jgi:hypothetical protein
MSLKHNSRLITSTINIGQRISVCLIYSHKKLRMSARISKLLARIRPPDSQTIQAFQLPRNHRICSGISDTSTVNQTLCVPDVKYHGNQLPRSDSWWGFTDIYMYVCFEKRVRNARRGGAQNENSYFTHGVKHVPSLSVIY